MRPVLIAPFPFRHGIGSANFLLHEVAVRNPPDRHVQPGHIDGFKRHPIGFKPWQDHARSGEADIGRLASCGDRDLDRLGQGGARLGRQASQKCHGARLVTDILYAKLIARGIDADRVGKAWRHRDEVLIAAARIERLGHADTGAGGGGGGVAAIGPDRKALGSLRFRARCIC